MKHILLYLWAFVAVGVLSLAAGEDTNERFHNTSSTGNNTLSFSANGSGTDTLTIPASATITVYDADGVALNPQPSLRISPTPGTSNHTYTIMDKDGDFPANGQVVISKVDYTGTGVSDGSWSHT